MWDLPRPGLEPVSPALAGRFSTTAPPGKPNAVILIIFFTQKISIIYTDIRAPSKIIILSVLGSRYQNIFKTISIDSICRQVWELLLKTVSLEIIWKIDCFPIFLLKGFFSVLLTGRSFFFQWAHLLKTGDRGEWWLVCIS